MVAAGTICFSVWQALLNNFSIERGAFTDVEMGIAIALSAVFRVDLHVRYPMLDIYRFCRVSDSGEIRLQC